MDGDSQVAKPLPARILGIETSCDETSAAVVVDGNVQSNVISSQLVHQKYGGVVPELASREHLRAIVPVVRLALEEAATELGGLSAVAVTAGPGLVGSLLVGISFAKAAAAAAGLPLVGVHHLAGHIESIALHNGEIPLPAIMLVALCTYAFLVLHDAGHDAMRLHVLETDETVTEPVELILPVEGDPAGQVWQTQKPLLA